jgi:hypothetical protein
LGIDNEWVRGRHRGGAATATPARMNANLTMNGLISPQGMRDREMERKELQADMPPSAHLLASSVLSILQNRSYSLRRADGTPAGNRHYLISASTHLQLLNSHLHLLICIGSDDIAMYADTEAKLRRIFHLTEASGPQAGATATTLQDQVSLRLRPNLSPERDRSDPFGRLTKRGRQMVREGHAVCSNLDVPYIGDVWSRPLCSYESVWMLRLVRPLAHHLNVAFKRTSIHGIARDAWTFDAPVRKLASRYTIATILFFVFVLILLFRWI